MFSLILNHIEVHLKIHRKQETNTAINTETKTKENSTIQDSKEAIHKIKIKYKNKIT